MDSWSSLSNEARLICTSAGLLASILIFRPTRQLASVALLGRRKPTASSKIEIPQELDGHQPAEDVALATPEEKSSQLSSDVIENIKVEPPEAASAEVDDLFYSILRQYRDEPTPSKIRRSEGRKSTGVRKMKHSHQRHSLNN